MGARISVKALVLENGCLLLNVCEDETNGVYYTLPGADRIFMNLWKKSLYVKFWKKQDTLYIRSGLRDYTKKFLRTHFYNKTIQIIRTESI